jgi:hypothetical protein
MATAAGDAAGRGSGRVNSNIVGTALRLCGVRCRHRQGRGRGRSTGTEKDFARFARRLLSTLVRKAFAAATSLPTRTRARKSRSPSQVRRNHGPALGLDTAANPCGWADESYNSAQMDEAECRVYCQTLRRSLKACLSAELRQPPPATAMRALLSSRTALGAEGGMHRWWASRQGISLFFVPSNA